MIIEMDDEFKTIPKEEYINRIKKIQKNMSKNDLDILLLSTPENIYYTTGYRSWYLSSPVRPVFAIIPREGTPAIVLRILEKSTVKFTSWLPEENIFVTGTESRNLGKLDAKNHIDAVYKAIESVCPDAKNIGYEYEDGGKFFWSLKVLDEIKNFNQKYNFTDGTLTIQESRMIKSEWEISKMRTAAIITERAVHSAFSKVVPGKTTEKDVSREIAKYMTGNGIDKISYLTVTSGIQKYTTLNAYATNRIIQINEILLVDISGHYDGYASDITRMMYVGNQVPPHIQEMADTSSKSVLEGKEVMKPGALISELSQTVEDVIRNSKFSDYLIHSSGHSIGLDVVEYPYINDDSKIPLEEGMILAVENGVYPFEKKDGAENMHLAFRMEDQILVTEHGSEWITGPSKSLYTLKDYT